MNFAEKKNVVAPLETKPLFIFRCHNYVQLQFHKSMIYSYGLHFYSIRFALQTKQRVKSFINREGKKCFALFFDNETFWAILWT